LNRKTTGEGNGRILGKAENKISKNSGENSFSIPGKERRIQNSIR
jgi:hypothetical protein